MLLRLTTIFHSRAYQRALWCVSGVNWLVFLWFTVNVDWNVPPRRCPLGCTTGTVVHLEEC